MNLDVGRALVGGHLVRGSVVVDDHRVTEVGAAPGRLDRVAIPGFVDLQINGFGGVDFRTAGADGLMETAAAITSTGTTYLLPTFYSSTIDGYIEALIALGEAHDRGTGLGARLGGAHLEGPFLSRTWAGAHDPQRLISPDTVALHRLLGAGPIALMTLAPELPDAFDLISRLRHAGVVVSMGHSDADAAVTRDAAEAGVAMLTHCWNAHRRFAPRDPGPAAVALDRMFVGLICDRVHVADDTLRLSFLAAAGRVCVVTDAVAPAGTDWSTWDIDGVEVMVAGGRACLRDGTLAGSVVTMDQSVRNLVDIGIAPEVALSAASTVPAAVIGVADHDLRPGSKADVAILDDDFEVVETIIGGRVVWRRDD